MKLCFIAVASAVHTRRWVQYFIDRGDEIHLISSRPLRKGMVINEAKLYVPKWLPVELGIISSAINLVQGAIQVRKLVKKINPDILHARYATDCGVWAALSGFHPFIIRPMGSDIFIDAKRNPLVRMAIKYSLRKADRVICNSEILKKGVIDLGADENKITIIYDGVDTQKFNPQKRDEELKKSLGISGAPTVISIRNFRPIYNLETLIRAIPLVLKEVPETRFIISGDGVQKESLHRLADLLGITEKIRFTGFLRNDKLPKYMASSDIYVSTALSDSNSISLQEAMASGLAPVVTDIPGNREFLTDRENCCFVSTGNPGILAEKIVYLLKNRAVMAQFGQACRQLIMERAEHRKEMAKMAKTYQELTGKS